MTMWVARHRASQARKFAPTLLLLSVAAIAFMLASPNFADDPPPLPPEGEEPYVASEEEHDLDSDLITDTVTAEPMGGAAGGGIAGAQQQPGRVEVQSGADGSLVVRITGREPGDRFGYSVAVATDLNADRDRDLIIGAPYDTGPGRAYTFNGPFGAPSAFELTADDATMWFGSPYGGDYHFGERVGQIYDLDGDDAKEIRIRAWFLNEQNVETAHTVIISGLTGEAMYLITGDDPFDPWAEISGDADQDGAVDMTDRRIVEQNLGLTGEPGTLGPGRGDLNGDGIVDSLDLAMVNANFGYSHFGSISIIVPGIPPECDPTEPPPPGYHCVRNCPGDEPPFVLLPSNIKPDCNLYVGCGRCDFDILGPDPTTVWQPHDGNGIIHTLWVQGVIGGTLDTVDWRFITGGNLVELVYPPPPANPSFIHDTLFIQFTTVAPGPVLVRATNDACSIWAHQVYGCVDDIQFDICPCGVTITPEFNGPVFDPFGMTMVLQAEGSPGEKSWSITQNAWAVNVLSPMDEQEVTLQFMGIGPVTVQVQNANCMDTLCTETQTYHFIWIDSDDDGLPNALEMLMGLDPYNPCSTCGGGIAGGVLDGDLDYDGDGLSNQQEILLGFNPTNLDTDGYGVLDGDEDPSSGGGGTNASVTCEPAHIVSVWVNGVGQPYKSNLQVCDGDTVRFSYQPISDHTWHVLAPAGMIEEVAPGNLASCLSPVWSVNAVPGGGQAHLFGTSLVEGIWCGLEATVAPMCIDFDDGGLGSQKEDEPKFVIVNDDDDNLNGMPDLQDEGAIENENDLLWFQLNHAGAQGAWRLNYPNQLRIWVNPNRTGLVQSGVNYSLPPPPKFYIEAIQASQTWGDLTITADVLIGTHQYNCLTVDLTALGGNLTVYRPLTLPFQEVAVDNAYEYNLAAPTGYMGAGIRFNGDDDNGDLTPDHQQTNVPGDDDLVKVELVGGPIELPPGFEWAVQRSNSNIKLWHERTKGDTEFFNTQSVVMFPLSLSPTAYVEWANSSGGSAELSLGIRRAGTQSMVAVVDRVKVYRFESVVIAVGGRNHAPTDPADSNHGTFQVAIDLYRAGYDVHMYHEDVVGYVDGSGPPYDEIVNAIENRGIHIVSIFGYSHGAGSTHDICARLSSPAFPVAGFFSIPFTSYVDAVEHSWEADVDQELRFPPGSAFHLNHYQHGVMVGTGWDGGLDGGPVPGSTPPPNGLDVETTPWGAGTTHSLIDELTQVKSAIISELQARVSR